MVLKPYRRNPAKYKGQSYNEWKRNQQAPFIPGMFGAKGDGITNDTEAIQALFDAMQEEGHPGLITQQHVITECVLNCQQEGPVDVPGPILFTAGNAEFIAAGINNAPIWSIYNNTPNQFVRGGFVGPLIFRDNTNHVADDRHGLYLSGVQDIHFGPIYGENIKGSLIYIPHRATDLDGNPVTSGGIGDYHHVFNCYFEMLEYNNGNNYCILNEGENQLLNGCFFQIVRAIFGKGLWHGATGAGNVLFIADCIGASEVALNFINNNGTCYRMLMVAAELDSPREGIRVSGLIGFDFGNIRMNHRRSDGLDAGGNYWIPPGETWPVKGITFGDTGGTVNEGRMNILHRLSPEIDNISKLSTLVDFSNYPNVINIDINQTTLDGVGIGITDAHHYTNVSPSSYGLVAKNNSRTILDTSPWQGTQVKYTGLVNNAGYATLVSQIIYNVASIGPHEVANYANGFYTVPYDARYQIMADLRLTGLAVGTLLRIAIMETRAGLIRYVKEFITTVSNINANTYDISCVEYLLKGDLIWVSAATNAGAPVAVDVGTGPQVNNRFQIYPVAFT